MQSGFTGGGTPEFYTAGRSISSIPTTTATNPPQPNPYRTHFPDLFLDRTTQQNPTSLVGKRTHTDFQSHYQNQTLNNLFLRSVKPRTFQNPSPIDFSPISSEILSQRLFKQFCPQPIWLSHNTNLPAIPLINRLDMNAVNLMAIQNRTLGQESEKMMMRHRLQELENQLLNDNEDDDGCDAVSVITNSNSEWSETIQNFISPSQSLSPSQKRISPSPTSSNSSSSSSASVVFPASGCWKQSVMEVANLISEGKSETVTEILTLLSSQVPNLKVSSSEQKLMESMVSSLKSRVNPKQTPPPVAELYSPEHTESTQLLYELSPCFKLGFLAANLAIIESTVQKVEESVNYQTFHVLDFNIGEGGQYLNLLHMLSTRKNMNQPIFFKLTTVTENGGEERLKKVGELLSQLAVRVGVRFKFNVMSEKLTELTRDSLSCVPDEPLAVNFAFKLYKMADESVSTENPRDELLRRVKGLSPCIVTLVEQELNTNTAPFATRVGETCAYYGALLDSIESTVPRDNSNRVKVELGLSQKLVNSVVCEGKDRVERSEVFGKWRARMGMAGFKLKPLSQNVAESMRTRLSSGYRVNPGFTVEENNGGVCFGWLGRTLTVASAWL